MPPRDFTVWRRSVADTFRRWRQTLARTSVTAVELVLEGGDRRENVLECRGLLEEHRFPHRLIVALPRGAAVGARHDPKAALPKRILRVPASPEIHNSVGRNASEQGRVGTRSVADAGRQQAPQVVVVASEPRLGPVVSGPVAFLVQQRHLLPERAFGRKGRDREGAITQFVGKMAAGVTS